MGLFLLSAVLRASPIRILLLASLVGAIAILYGLLTKATLKLFSGLASLSYSLKISSCAVTS